MLVSLNEIKKYINLDDLSLEDIVKKLTFAGIEVEQTLTQGYGTNLTIGEVLSCEDIPETHLHNCQVNIGNGTILKIVCGAPNVRKGLKVVVALDGCKLKDGDIKKSVIRGFESNGMLCSLSELGVDKKLLSEKENSGIHEVTEKCEVGDKDVLKILGLDDVIMDLKILPNRKDLLSIENIVKEFATLFPRKYKEIEVKDFKETDMDFSVSIETEKCPLFSARVIKGIKVKESPKWLQDFLSKHGMRSISNVVDIGNYIMLLLGNPVHVYDYDKLKKKELVIKEGVTSKCVALDEKTYDITPNDIVITSGDDIACIAGVMGGNSTKDDENTKNLVLEVASFDGSAIRQTSKRLGIPSEASSRYMKNVDCHNFERVSKLATNLFFELAEAKEASKIVVINNLSKKEHEIKTSSEKINSILSSNLSSKEIIDTLKRDHLDVKDIKGNNFTVSVPFSRDLDGENDLAEEVIRILGTEIINREMPLCSMGIGKKGEKYTFNEKISDYLIALGNYRVNTYSLLSKKEVNTFNLIKKGEPYKIINPLTDEHEYLRTCLSESILKCAQYNVDHQNKNFGIFEIQDVDTKDYQTSRLSICLLNKTSDRYEMNKQDYDYYSLSGLFEGVLSVLGIDKKRIMIKQNSLYQSYLHEGKSSLIYLGNELIGFMGQLHPLKLDEFGLKNQNVYILEVDLDKLYGIVVGNLKISMPSKFPSIKRDYAFTVPNDINSHEVLKLIKTSSSDGLIKNIDIFDYYEDKDKSIISLGISITYGSDEKTLKDEDIISQEQKIYSNLNNKKIFLKQ